MQKLAVAPKIPRASRNHRAAELAQKAYTVAFDRNFSSEMQQIADAVNLTEAPEDAICSLVIDLMQYCEHEKIDWTTDVMSRARKRFRSQCMANV